MSVPTEHLLKTARTAAVNAGNLLRESAGNLNRHQVGMKGAGDYVTELDCQSEDIIIRTIKDSFPDHVIHAEESGKENQQSDYTWIIDPLDGTANYVQGVPVYGISIACLVKNRIMAGVIYDPERDEYVDLSSRDLQKVEDYRIIFTLEKNRDIIKEAV